MKLEVGKTYNTKRGIVGKCVKVEGKIAYLDIDRDTLYTVSKECIVEELNK